MKTIAVRSAVIALLMVSPVFCFAQSSQSQDDLAKIMSAEGWTQKREAAEFSYYDFAAKHGGIPEAIRYLEKIAAASPADNTKLSVSIAEGYLRLRDRDKAIKIYEGLSQANPGDQELFSRLVNQYMNKQDFMKVIEKLEPVVMAHVDDPAYFETLSMAYAKTRKLKEYERLYRNLMEKNPRSVDFKIKSAAAFSNIGMPEKALAALADALKIEPANQLVKEQVAQIYKDAGSDKALKKRLEKIMKLTPDEASLFDQDK